MRTRAALVTAVAAAGLALTGCGHTPPPAASSSGSSDQLGSLEASVDAISRQVDSDTAG